jgi:hypothetical protein
MISTVIRLDRSGVTFMHAILKHKAAPLALAALVTAAVLAATIGVASARPPVKSTLAQARDNCTVTVTDPAEKGGWIHASATFVCKKYRHSVNLTLTIYGRTKQDKIEGQLPHDIKVKKEPLTNFKGRYVAKIKVRCPKGEGSGTYRTGGYLRYPGTGEIVATKDTVKPIELCKPASRT